MAMDTLTKHVQALIFITVFLLIIIPLISHKIVVSKYSLCWKSMSLFPSIQQSIILLADPSISKEKKVNPLLLRDILNILSSNFFLYGKISRKWSFVLIMHAQLGLKWQIILFYCQRLLNPHFAKQPSIWLSLGKLL